MWDSQIRGAGPRRLRPPPRAAARPGGYLHSQRDLYRVEELVGDRVLVEDCRNGTLIEIGPEQLLALEPVIRSASRPGDGFEY